MLKNDTKADPAKTEKSKDGKSEEKSKKKVNFDYSMDNSLLDLNNSLNFNDKDKKSDNQTAKTNKDNKPDKDQTNKYNDNQNSKKSDKKKEVDPMVQSEDFTNLQNKYGDEDDYFDYSNDKLGSRLTVTENNNHYPTNRGSYQSKMDQVEKDYLTLVKKFEKVLASDEKVEKLEDNREYDKEVELLQKQNTKLIKNLEKMNDILDVVVDNTRLYQKKNNAIKQKKNDKIEKKERNKDSKSSKVTASIGDNRLVEVYKQDYLKHLKRYETVSKEGYMMKLEQNLFNLNEEVETLSKENKALSNQRKVSETKFELKNHQQKLQPGSNSDLSITSFDYNTQRKLLEEMIEKIDKNKFDIKSNEEKLAELTMKYNKYREIAGFYGITEDSIAKMNVAKKKDKVAKIEKFSLQSKMNILYNASNSMKKKYEQLILKNEKQIFQLKNVRMQAINYFKIKSAIEDEVTKQVKQMYELMATYEDERFLRSLEEDNYEDTDYRSLNSNLRRSVDNPPMRHIDMIRFEEERNKERIKMERRNYLPREEADLMDSLDNAKKFMKDFQHNKNMKYDHDEKIEYEDEEQLAERMNKLRRTLQKSDLEQLDEEKIDSEDEKLEKELIAKYSKKKEKKTTSGENSSPEKSLNSSKGDASKRGEAENKKSNDEEKKEPETDRKSKKETKEKKLEDTKEDVTVKETKKPVEKKDSTKIAGAESTKDKKSENNTNIDKVLDSKNKTEEVRKDVNKEALEKNSDKNNSKPKNEKEKEKEKENNNKQPAKDLNQKKDTKEYVRAENFVKLEKEKVGKTEVKKEQKEGNEKGKSNEPKDNNKKKETKKSNHNDIDDLII